MEEKKLDKMLEMMEKLTTEVVSLGKRISSLERDSRTELVRHIVSFSGSGSGHCR